MSTNAKNIHKRTQMHINTRKKRTQTHEKMLINYVKFHTNAHKCIYMHKNLNTQTYVKSTQTHVKTQTNAR